MERWPRSTWPPYARSWRSRPPSWSERALRLPERLFFPVRAQRGRQVRRHPAGSGDALERAEQVRPILLHALGDFQELHDVEPPLTPLVLRDVRLGPAQTLGKARLGEAGRPAGLDEQPSQPL